jgi:hypothetical protein
MKHIGTGRAESWLPVMIRLTAIGYLLFFVPDLGRASTRHISGLPPVFARLFDWGGELGALHPARRMLAAGPAQQRPMNAGGATLGMVE